MPLTKLKEQKGTNILRRKYRLMAKLQQKNHSPKQDVKVFQIGLTTVTMGTHATGELNKST